MNTINNPKLANFASRIENEINEFVTLHTRPIYTADNRRKSELNVGIEKSAFIIQGPINKEYNYTIETIKLYRKIFPDVLLIVSTWDDETIEALDIIESLGVKVIKSKKPTIAGIGNVNYQIRSTKNGIEYAASCNAKYVLKTRTDVRIHAEDFLIHANDLMAQFPLTENVQAVQKKRLVSISSGNKYLMNFVPDLNMFGHIDDMVKYWSPKEDDRNYIADNLTIVDLAKFGVSESYFFQQYFKQINTDFDYSIKGYWSILKNHFVVMDGVSADVYWFRHNRYREFKNIHYLGRNTYDNFGFKDWLRLHVGRFPIACDIEVAQRGPGEFF